MITLRIGVGNLDEILALYDEIKVYRSSSYSGTYAEITTADTRIPLAIGITVYSYVDSSGVPTNWYKTSFFNSGTGVESAQSDPQLGDDSVALQHIMTVDQLKETYLLGLDLTTDDGTPYPDIMYEFGIRMAIAWIETELRIKVRPTVIADERQDYDQLNWQQWGFLQLDNHPIISVESVKMYWPSSAEGWTFPSEWLRVQKRAGQVNIVPTSGQLAQAMIIQGAWLPTVLSNIPYVPDAIAIAYTAGFAIGELPADIRDLIGMKAAFPTLNTAGDLIAGAGIANYSLSVDGLSQSVGTTSSATNSGYGARLIQYDKEIKSRLPMIRKYWKNVQLAMG